MPKTKRYIIGSRSSPKLDPQAAQELETFIAKKNEASLVKRTPVGRHVVEMTEDQKRELESKNPDLVIEEDQELEMYPMPGLPQEVVSQGQFSLRVVVKDSNTGRPVPNVTIFGVGQGPAYRATTDGHGRAVLETNEDFLSQIIASPADTYWSRVVKDVSLGDGGPLEIKLKPLMITGAYSWGHRLMGFGQVSQYWTGRDIKVGIIDSGIDNTLKDVKPVGGYNTLEGAEPDTWYIDEKGHGTHCAGIIAGLSNTFGILGGAPNAQVYSLKVFPGGFVSDLVEAIEWCIKNGMD
ncbi:MAG TPA: S8 family serine peptidase, partial [Blastocatellia bacterium]|nr:S8 family serine peptidase [Blastocatellia bacterium]